MEDLVTTPVVEARSLSHRYGGEGGTQALDGVGLTLEAGRILGLLGPNGAGKTTLLSILSGLLEPTTGVVRVAGFDLAGDRRRAQRRLGLVPQEIALYPGLTVVANLDFWGSLYGLPRERRRRRCDEVLALVGLEERRDTPVGQLSGGLKRRLNIAVGLLHEPRVLFLDEPTVGVDPDSRRRILDSVRELCRGGLAALYSTHYMEEAEALADDLLVLDRGRVVARGTPSEVKALSGLPRRGRIEVDGDSAEGAAALLREHTGDVEVAAGGRLAFPLEGGWRDGAALLEALAAAGVAVRSFELREPNLEEVFLHLTGRRLAD